MDKTSSCFTGYGYDVAKLAENMSIIGRILGYTIGDYGLRIKSERLVNVTVPNWEFVAIGIKTEPCNVHMPCIMHNIVTDEWAWANDLIYFADKDGFCWSNGHYVSEQTAREEFAKHTDGMVWYSEDF